MRFLLPLLSALSLALCGCELSQPQPQPQPQPQMPAAPVRPAEDEWESAYRWFSVPIEVKGLPPHAGFAGVTCPADFSAWMEKLGVPGVADTRSVRLYQLGPGAARVEEPVQFTASAQPRPGKRALLPDTPPNVSYAGEYRAGVTPPGVKVAGELTWIAKAGADGVAHYQLEFGTLRDGTVVQVPYPPQDLRAFDGQGRATRVRQFPTIQVRPQRPLDGQVQLFDGEQLITAYHLGPSAEQAAGAGAAAAAGETFFRRPFLYPVIGLDGIPLTGFGKPHDPTGSHDHHYSLWVGHASVNGKDFWNERGGLLVNDGLESTEDGPVFCRLVQRIKWIVGGAELLHERRRVTLYRAAPAFRALDIDLELTPAGEDVTLGKTSFGFLAARVAPSMSVFDGGGETLNANGDRNERGAHLKRADWIDQSGPVAPQRWGGLALLDHPDNPNHPTTWHCRNDGWAGAAFNADGPTTVKAGAALRLRYRVLLHRHDAAGGGVAAHYADYAAKPTVQIGEPAPLDRSPMTVPTR